MESERLAKQIQVESQRITETGLDYETRQAIATAALSILVTPDSASRDYLHYWLQSYTLFSLLRETPDIQSVVVKLFSSGRIWLDTNIVLPVLAEELVDDDRQQYTTLLRAAVESGQELFVTPGVIEELVHHMRRSIAYLRNSQQGRSWSAQIPFLYTAHALSGRPRDDFMTWLNGFRGESEPEADLAEYLEERLGVTVRSLEEHSDQASIELRGAVKEIFYEAKERRNRAFNPINLARLVSHDVECYVGVIQLRKREHRSPLGFNSWWLTLDNTAYRAASQLKGHLSAETPISPVMSPDFLLNYLSLGPVRTRLRNRSSLPLVLDISVLEGVSPELMAAAEKVRTEQVGQPERLVRRRIRDTLNAMRLRSGAIAEAGGAAFVESEVLAAIEDASTSPTD